LSNELPKIHSQTGATTVKHLSNKDLEAIVAWLPPLAEQKKIADILSSVDEVIENTESEINKLEDLKKATLNELLTKGIGHTEFKESEIGRIPKSWEVKSLLEICVQGGLQTGPFGGQLHAEEYVQVGVPVVMPQDISGSFITTANIARVSEEKTSSLQRHRLQVGDIVFSRRGDIGRFALVTEENDGWICGTGCIRARPRQELVLSGYLSTYCRLEQTNRWLIRNAVGQTMPNLSTEILSNLPIAIPTHAEQTFMIGVSQSIDFAIESKRRWFRVASMVRQALMQDLLTGKVRVKVN